jgi:hypothetical protein
MNVETPRHMTPRPEPPRSVPSVVHLSVALLVALGGRGRLVSPPINDAISLRSSKA